MQLVCRQTVIHTIADDDVSDPQSVRSILQYFKQNRNELSVTIIRNGQTHSFNRVRLLKIHSDDTVDFISADSSHTFTVRKIPFSGFVSVSATIKEPISPEELASLRLEDLFEFDSEGETTDSPESKAE